VAVPVQKRAPASPWARVDQRHSASIPRSLAAIQVLPVMRAAAYAFSAWRYATTAGSLRSFIQK